METKQVIEIREVLAEKEKVAARRGTRSVAQAEYFPRVI